MAGEVKTGILGRRKVACVPKPIPTVTVKPIQGVVTRIGPVLSAACTCGNRKLWPLILAPFG